MAQLDELGVSLIVGQQKVIHGSTITFSSYIVKSSVDGERTMSSEDVEDEDGKLTTREIYDRHDTSKLVLICKAGALPTTDFPSKKMCVLSGLTQYFVNSAPVNKSRSPNEVNIDLENLGIS